MSTPQQALSAISAKIATTLSATRAASDFLIEEVGFTAGETKFQIRKAINAKPGDSNTEMSQLALEIEVHHRLADPDNEQSYGDGNLLTYSQQLLTESFYHTLAEVFSVTVEPTLELGDIRRIGNLISFTVTLAVAVQP